MAKKISQLTQATQVKSDDVTVIVQDGETKKLPLNMMVTKQDIENKKVAGLAKLDEIEATYENDTYTPTITVKNKSSVKVGEGDEVDYSANVMDGHVKSAILSGNTLVNLIDNGSERKEITYSRETKANYRINKDMLVANKTYLLLFTVTDFSGDAFHVSFNKSDQYGITRLTDIGNGLFKAKVNFSDLTSVTDTLIIYKLRGTALGGYVEKVMLIEYQEGMENLDIPYFEGMQSVRMPVLTTTGKNLFDINNANIFNGYSGGDICVGNNNMRSLIFNVKEGCTYTIQKTNESSRFAIDCTIAEPKEGTKVKRLFNVNTATEATVTIPIGYNYIVIYYANSEVGDDLDIMPILQIEESSTATSYEPFKSNILSTPEEVVLRSLPNGVKDTLNLTTGEYVQRIGEVVLDGSERIVWGVASDDGKLATTICFTTYKYIKDAIMNSAICSHFQQKYTRDDIEHFYNENSNSNQALVFFINRDKLTTPDYDGFNQWLSQNPITIQYELATPVVKTVDLMPSGTHPSTTPYCWKNGHIQLSSSGLLPNLEYSVVTSRAGQINQNATMVVKNDKRIFDLEILLAGGLVNTTYQALTLQNQVETGLSKVSLNSETEPDYLLYHMIMKLIEEKAYKLDDLTEKVSVFYLYEKLSDEQFETIYSALYPFVEDEIVEEPVVEELPEVVEDEVIM